MSRSFLPALAVLAGLSGCATTYEYSPDQSFEATVIQLIYLPPGSSRSVNSSSGWFAGKAWAGSTAGSTTTDAVYVAIFEGPDGKFTVEGFGKGSLASELWSKLKEGQRVTIKYRKVYEIVWRQGAKEKDRVRERVFQGNELLGAQPIGKVDAKDF